MQYKNFIAAVAFYRITIVELSISTQNKINSLGACLLVLFLLSTLSGFAENDSLSGKFHFKAFADFYFSTDFTHPANTVKPDFVYNHKKLHSPGVNLLMADFSYVHKLFRSSLGLMTGNYSRYNLSAEPSIARHIYEGNLGVKLSRNHSLWIDAGIMPSHIGFESVISADCWNLTRSLLAEKSPYYESGIRISYTSKNAKWYLAGFLLNGWQRIRILKEQKTPSTGIQVTYTPNNKLLLNYSNFIGYDKPDSLNAQRIFHNVYMQYTTDRGLGVTAGLDFGVERAPTGNFTSWYSPVIILRQVINKKINAAVRGEYYSDPGRVMIETTAAKVVRISGLSGNIDAAINKRMLFRLEGKWLHSPENIFTNGKNNQSITANFTYRFPG